MARAKAQGQKAQQQYAAYFFGVAFVVTMLVIAVLVPDPQTFPLFIFRSVMALSAAGVAAMIPGFLNVQLGTSTRAGGAIAVFVIMYFLNPPDLVSVEKPGTPPPSDPREVAQGYLQVADTLDFEKVWALFADTAKQRLDKAALSEAYSNVRIPLGKSTTRQLQAVSSATSLPGWPVAHYRGFNFLTVFEGGASRIEQVTIMSEENAWHVASHIIMPIASAPPGEQGVAHAH
jgi:hypothetical protein